MSRNDPEPMVLRASDIGMDRLPRIQPPVADAAMAQRMARLLDMAFAMQREAERLPAAHRFARLHPRYTDLYNMSPGMFHAALECRLDEDGPMGGVIRAITSAGGDPAAIRQNIHQLADDVICKPIEQYVAQHHTQPRAAPTTTTTPTPTPTTTPTPTPTPNPTARAPAQGNVPRP